MSRTIARWTVSLIASFGVIAGTLSAAEAECALLSCPTTDLDDGAANVLFSGAGVAQLGAGSPQAQADYSWRLRRLCVLSDEQTGRCSGKDFRACPVEVGRVIESLVVQRRPVVRPDLTSVDGPVPAGFQPGDLL